MKTIALIAAAVLAGCDADAPEPAVSSPAALASPDAAALTAHRLRIESLPGMRLLATPEAREVLAHAVSCALPAGASLTAIAGDGTPYSFAGSAGLAPSWASRAPTAGERRRLIDCVRGVQAVPAGEPDRWLVGTIQPHLPRRSGS
jgi:hypothetical protein